MKIVYVANDGNSFENQRDALKRDVAENLEHVLGKFLVRSDAESLEGFIKDSSRYNPVICGILAAVSEMQELERK